MLVAYFMLARKKSTANTNTVPPDPPLLDSPVCQRSPAPIMRTITNPYFCEIYIKTSNGLKLFNAAVKGPNEAEKFDMLLSSV